MKYFKNTAFLGAKGLKISLEISSQNGYFSLLVEYVILGIPTISGSIKNEEIKYKCEIKPTVENVETSQPKGSFFPFNFLRMNKNF